MSTVNIKRRVPRTGPIEVIEAVSAFNGETLLSVRARFEGDGYAALAWSSEGRGIHLTAKQVRDLATALDELATQVGA